MLTAELDNHLGYDPYERTDSANARNGKKQKTLCSKYGEIPIEVPQEREGSFEPQIVKKRDKRIFQVSMVVALIKDEADAAIADEI
ncbi:transposase [Clostridium neonatale]|uniref:Mutator family transposase n=1 Tax=Clostridium neonatale TaxID=137838 RepID=A0AA86JWR7_9CLOT|nr:transposase [Clostridium neonatale]CAG9701870.1 transposase [Clostridium neonatale]CAI3207816.1 transposase [Clostridium neonatale]CAI3589806.1 transposase [Clostridium neonatale]CAI3604107.1 transposase [Clostridium neonatale]CAI3607512.1 transposase [Clostridium neonatale]